MKYLLFSLIFLIFYSCNNTDYSIDNLNSGKIKTAVLFALDGDSCSSTLEIIDSSVIINSTTQGFSNSFLAPSSCSDSPSPDKVYKVVLDSTKKFTAEIFNSDLDSVLFLRRTCEGVALVCNDDKNNNDYQSKISAVLEAGEYFLVVDGYGQNSVDTFELRVDISDATGESCSDMKCKTDYKCEIQSDTPVCICDNGNCEVPNGLKSGDITINEFMPNPSGSDRYNEWIELKNNTNNDIKIDNLKIVKDNTSYILRERDKVIKKNSYFLIAKSPNVNLETYDAIISNLTLSNSGNHTLKLYVNDVKVDETVYSGSSSGVSYQFDGSEWCKSKAVISDSNSDKGTPAVENTVCGDLCAHNCSNHGNCNEVDGSCECEGGYTGDICNQCENGYRLNGSTCEKILSQLLNERDIIITEFIPNPAGSDGDGEYIEIYNRTNEDLSLDGLRIIKDDTTPWVLDNGHTINAYSHFLITRSSSFPDSDAVMTSMSINNTGEHSLILEIDDFALDSVSYNNSEEGLSVQLDINKYDDDFDTNNWCDKDSSPKEENLPCSDVDLCENVNCNSGECISDISGYLCICQPGYGGDNCDVCDETNPDCPKLPNVKSIVITELMINPDGSDSLGEWIEVYNHTTHKLKLENVKIQKDSIIYNVNLINTVISPNSYYLIARNSSIPNADAVSSFSLNNTGVHTVSILVNGEIIDSMTYESSKSSISYQLDSSILNADSNDNLNYWCDGTAEIENYNDKGTPKSVNRGCGSCATLECPLNSVCVSRGDEASCDCNAGYEMNEELGICTMTEQCGVLYDSVRDLTGDDLKIALQQLTGQKYNPVEYDVSRKIMYREIDMFYKNGKKYVRGVYTGRVMEIKDDEELDSRSGDCNIRTCYCGNKGMNTEHTFPQSKFDKQEPMKGDVHHLFPVDACTNGRRSSYKFGNVVSSTGTFGSLDYKDEFGAPYGFSKLGVSNGRTVFEPPLIHKGDVARAMFYFVIRYGNYSNFLDDDQEAVLRQWAIDDPVSNYERIRNTKIEKLQWNRNPFVDCPQLIDVIPDF